MKLIGITGTKQSGKDTVATMIQYLNSDKNYSDEEIINNLHKKPISSYEKRQFAYPLKKLVSILTGCKMSDLESDIFKNSKLPKEWVCYKCTVEDLESTSSIYFTNFYEADRFIKEGNYLKNEVKNLNLKDAELSMSRELPTYREVLQNIGTNLLREKLNPNVFIIAMFKSDMSKKNIIITDVRFLNEAKAIKDRKGIIIKVEKENNTSTDTHISETEVEQIPYDYIISAKEGDLYSMLEQVKRLIF
jgi:hypothetical protein